MSYDNNARRLQQIDIASPCSAAWSEMSGDHRSRHCAHCNKRVYNLSQMSSEDALAMLDRDAGGVCIQIYRRRDGTVLTSDCPKGRTRGLNRAYRRAVPAASLVAAAFAVATYVGGSPVEAKPSKEKLIYINMDIDNSPPVFAIGGKPVMPPKEVAVYKPQRAALPPIPDPGKFETPPWEGEESI